VTAAIDADLTAVIENVGAGGDIDQSHRSQAVFGRQRAGDQTQAANPAGVENAAEAGRPVGQHDAVDTVLHVGMVIADVKEPARRRILRDPGSLQQNFLHRLVVAAGKRLDGRLGNGGGRCADRRVEAAARLVEGIRLGVELRGWRWRGNMHLLRLRLRFRARHDDLRQLDWRGLRFGKIRESDQRPTGATADNNSAVRTNRHDTSPPNWPGKALGRQQPRRAPRRDVRETAAFNLAGIAGAATARGGAARSAMNRQASGGARDWNGARRGAMKKPAAQSNCSIVRQTSGTRSCGAAGVKELATR